MGRRNLGQWRGHRGRCLWGIESLADLRQDFGWKDGTLLPDVYDTRDSGLDVSRGMSKDILDGLWHDLFIRQIHDE